VSAGGNHTCGLTSTGSVECWGDDGSGQSTPPNLAIGSDNKAHAALVAGRDYDGPITCN
jgi:alpha-tubulin suppressor-like RCC1 family protein